MTYKEISDVIKTLNIPYAYYQFPEGTAQPCPFICFYYPERTDVFADDKNYKEKTQLVVELYTDTKDFATETAVETALSSAGFSYSKFEAHIDSENMWQITYEMEVYLDV